jgi:hypothetical protein
LVIIVEEKDLTRLWGRLSVEASRDSERALRSISESGAIYASWNISEQTNELIIKLDREWPESSTPNWRGVAFSVEDIRTPSPSKHLVMGLQDKELGEVFSVFCIDALATIDGAPPGHLTESLLVFIKGWDAFFQRAGNLPLSPEKQRGLYAELWWLRRLIESGVPPLEGVTWWLGPERAYHDFESDRVVVEVKSTIRKEPRKVVINNERQLDDSNIDELHLFVLTLDIHKEGESLPGIIEDIRERMEQAPLAMQRLRRKLTLARYLDSDAGKYDSRYKPRSEELFKVGEGFPRITKLDPGVGDLKYSIQISSCKEYEHGIEEFLGV